MPLFSKARKDAAPRAPKRPTPEADRKAKAKKGKPQPLAQDVTVSPFFADHTRAGLADRFNELNARRSDSVLVLACLSVCLLISLGMNAFQASRSHIEPYMVVVENARGHLLAHGPLEPMNEIEDIYIQREIREIVSGLRTVTSDRAATTSRFNAAYGKVVAGSAGASFLTDYFLRAGNHPDDMMGRNLQRTIVEFTGPTPVAGTNTWTVQWVERTATGTGVTEDLFRGSMTLDIRPVEDLATAEANPLGIWMDGIQWEKMSSKYLDLDQLGGTTPMELLYPDPNRRPGSPGFEDASGTPAAPASGTAPSTEATAAPAATE
ncbi:MAG: type IV secretion system protein [Myxococcota bacterium]